MGFSPTYMTPKSDGKRVYPSKEEAEYSAVLAFAIAVSASWWAARTGLATLAKQSMYIGRGSFHHRLLTKWIEQHYDEPGDSELWAHCAN